MEGGEVFRVSSARISTSNIWRNSGRDFFSRSSHEEDDEEALKWAAIEKLPTYLRLERGILTEEKGFSKEIDIKNLGLVETRNLLDRLVRIAEQDNDKFLLKLKERIDRVGLKLPTIEVRFEHLNVDAEAYVGGRALPTISNFVVNILEGSLNYLHLLPSRKKSLPILHDVSGIVKPGRMTLLLGPPSSGKTTLLLALAGKLGSDLHVSGKVTYNGHEMNEFVPQRTSAYISQYDLHIGEMTVRETLAFSARCQGVGSNYEMLAELSRREKEANIKPDPDLDLYMKAASMEGQEASVVTEYVMKILGLEVCADTVVGDEMFRGISGGQKKRVTTGEMMVGPSRALFMDEISTGLDSSTTFQIVNSIRQSIHILEGTCVISLLQPAPETYNLFDDVILLSDGQVVYQGPLENVLEFFDYMGFKCPERKAVADFLQEVTSKKDQEQYWVRTNEPYSFVTVQEFAETFQLFHVGRKLGDELAAPFDRTKSHHAALTTKKYGVSRKELLKACVSREYLLMKRNSFVYIFKMTQLIFLATTTMTVFLRTEMPRKTIMDGTIYMGALFFTLLTITFNGFSELGLSIIKLPVFYKQRDLLFFPAWIYSLPTWILKIPVTFVEVATWVIMTYYVVGYDPDVGRFFRQLLLFICIHQMASALFRFMAALGRNIIVANTFGSLAVLAIMVLGGFVLSRDDIKNWWAWGYWVSPLMYGQNGMAVNEFLGKSWSQVLPNSTETLGVAVLKSRGLFTEAKWYWICVGALVGYIFLFNIFNVLALTYLNPFGKPQAVLSEETLAARNAIKIKENAYGDTKNEVQTSVSSRSMSSRVATTTEADKKTKRGMVLPFVPLSLTFDEVRYAVDMPQEMKAQGVTQDKLELLKDVSGCFRPGVLTALMGISGAGKTTLMDVLAGRKTGGYTEGRISISGYPKKQETYARIAGYCEQTDIHSPHVTVSESLQYSAWLRLPPEVDSATRKMFIKEVMELVELTQLSEALVGLPGVNGLSTEQRKRLTIAVELVANPSIIFMDEPTSGLDARAAAIVMRTVRNTVDTGRTVVCTIHQPSIDIFDAFDELLLLKRGGEEIYFGPLGRHCAHLIKYFEDINGVNKIKDGYNPATWMLEVTSGAQESALGVNFAEIYKNSELYKRNKKLISEHSQPVPGSCDIHFRTQYSQSFWTQCMACLWKQYWSYWRNPQYTAVRFLFTTFIAVMFGTIFWDMGSKREKTQDLFNAMGSMYAAVTFIGVQNAVTVQPVVSIERTVFYRERAAGMYSAFPYAFGQVMIEIPYIFFQTIVYGIIVYAMIGYEWIVVKFFWHGLFMELQVLSDKPLKILTFTHVIHSIRRMNQKHKNETENRALQSILFSMLQQEDENKAMRALVTVCDLHRRKVWFDDRAANAICRACFHPSSRIMIAALSFLLDYEKIEQEGDSDESDDEEEAVHQSHVVVSKEAIYKANNTGTTSSKKKKKAKLQRVIRSMKKQQRISSDRDSNSNYYSPLSSLKDPQGFAEKLFSRLQTCSERFEIKMMILKVVARTVGLHRLVLLNFYPFLQKYAQPHQRDITNLLAAAVQACHDMVPPDAVEPLFKQIVNQFVHDKSRTESIAVGLNVVREICLRIPLLMTEDLLQDLVQYKKSHEKAVSSAARSLISLFREICPSLLIKKDRGRPTDPKKKPKAFGEVTIPSDVPGADLLRDDDGNDDVSDASDDDDHSIGTLGEEDANSEDDMSTHDGGSEMISDGDEDDTLMGSDEDEVSEDEDDSGSDSDEDDVKSIDGMSIDSHGSDKVRGQKRKFVDFDDQIDSASQSLRALKRLAGAKSEFDDTSGAKVENEDTSDVTDGILSNEDFRRIKELKAKKDAKLALANHGILKKASDPKSEPFRVPSSDQLSLKRVDGYTLEANIRKKMTKEERKALIKAGREDSVKYQSKAAVKQKKTGGLSNKQKEHKKAMPIAAKRSKIERSKRQKKIKQRGADKQFRGRKAWK